MRRILVGIDGSPRSDEVLAAALGLARRSGARLDLVHAVVAPSHLPPDLLRVSPDDVPRLLVEHELAALRRRLGAVPEGIVAEVHARVGAPWQVLCELARELDVDLVVIGAHGYGVVDRVLGTTAAKVVNRADRAVLVVRAGERLQ